MTPQTKRDIEAFFTNSLWYGFTGTPIFEENKYVQKGDLAQTTGQLYGDCLHSYTIKEAIHDNAVLGFMVENLGAAVNKHISQKGNKGESAGGSMPELDRLGAYEEKFYGTETHMRQVLDVILNRSYAKFGAQNGRGRSYEAILTVESIPIAQKYYDLLKRVKNGEDELEISEDMKKALPDFPKFAITYSISENEERSRVDQEKMKESLRDYNEMFGTAYRIENIQAYNEGLNDRLARKKPKYFSRDQQLDLVIVVDRLLTGFDAPCLSTVFMDRQPMSPQNIIQTFSRTNRLFDKNKEYGQIVTFQAHAEFKKAIDDALRLYSRGGSGNPISEDFDDVKDSFVISLKALRILAQKPSDVASLSTKQKKSFVHLFRDLDHDFAHLKAFTVYNASLLDELGFSEEEYEDYAAMYKNVVEELKKQADEPDSPGAADEPVYDDYTLVAYSKLKIDFEYIVELLRGVVELIGTSGQGKTDDNTFAEKIKNVRSIIDDFAGENPKLARLLIQIVDEIEWDKSRFIGEDIYATINKKRFDAVDAEVEKFAKKWYLKFDDVKYEVVNFQNGELSNESMLKDSADYAAYKSETSDPLPKIRFRKKMIEDFKENLMPEISPLME